MTNLLMPAKAALCVVSANANVTIYTDSQVAMDGINQILKGSIPTYITNGKCFNQSLWLAIAYIINTLQITLTIEKVKAHTGDLYNEKVDNIAKQGCFSPYEFEWNSNFCWISVTME